MFREILYYSHWLRYSSVTGGLSLPWVSRQIKRKGPIIPADDGDQIITTGICFAEALIFFYMRTGSRCFLVVFLLVILILFLVMTKQSLVTAHVSLKLQF